MRAITYTRFGPADQVLTFGDQPTPTPAPGEVLVALRTSAVNPSDVRARAGGRPGVTKPPFPTIIPHSDGAGVIEAVGQGVDPARLGQRVWIWNGQWQRPFGTAAEYIALPAEQAVAMPDALSFEQGAVLGIPGLTACHTVLGNGPVAGKSVLISGAAGRVGHIAVQIAARSGAHVIATARGSEAMQAARDAGAAHVLDYTQDGLDQAILDANGAKPIDRIVEVEFGANIATNTAVIAEGGTLVSYGSAKSMTPELPFYPLMFKAVTIELALIYLLSPENRQARIADLNRLQSDQPLDLRIGARMPLADCAKAHQIIEDGGSAGAVILTV